MNGSVDIDSVRSRILSIIADSVSGRVLIAGITDEAELVNDLGIDSLELLSVAMLLESEFDVRIPDDLMASIPTVGSLTRFIADRLAVKQ